MKKVALVNNTRNQLHHGCELVVKQIEQLLGLRDILVPVHSYEGQSWDRNKEFVKLAAQCDGIIINGEGTIHHNRPAGRKLLEVANFAEEKSIPCFLINATYQANPPEFERLLSKLTNIYVRESSSYRELEKIDVKSTVVPDLTLSYSHIPQNCSRSGVSVTDSPMSSVAELLYRFSQVNGYDFLPVIRSFKNEGRRDFIELLRDVKFELAKLKLAISKEDASYLKSRNIYVRKTIDEYITAVASSSLIISGRFHCDCFCILTDTPFVALEGNTHKVQSMISDIGLSADRLIQPDDLSKLLDPLSYQYSTTEKFALQSYREKSLRDINECFDSIAGRIWRH